MTYPRTYKEWSDLLYQLKQGEDEEETLLKLESGTLEWTAGVAEKITRLVFEVLEERLHQTVQSFQKELNRSDGSEAAIVVAIMNARRRFGFLERLCRLQVFPEEVRTSFIHIHAQYVQDTQKSLEDSAKADRSGRLRILIKNNSLLNYNNPEVAKPPQASSPSNDHQPKPFTTTRRRVLFK